MSNMSGSMSRSCYRAVLFSFIQAPAIALFIGFMFVSFNNSIANTFLSSARSLTANVPADKVQLCVYEKRNDDTPPSHTQKKPCVNTLTDAREWAKSVDARIRNIYFSLVVLGFATWFVFEGSAKNVIMKIREIWERSKK